MNDFIIILCLIALYPYFADGLGRLCTDISHAFKAVVSAAVWTVCKLIIYVRLLIHDR